MNRFTKELWDGEWSHFVELDGNETKVLGEGWAHPIVAGEAKHSYLPTL